MVYLPPFPAPTSRTPVVAALQGILGDPPLQIGIAAEVYPAAAFWTVALNPVAAVFLETNATERVGLEGLVALGAVDLGVFYDVLLVFEFALAYFALETVFAGELVRGERWVGETFGTTTDGMEHLFACTTLDAVFEDRHQALSTG